MPSAHRLITLLTAFAGTAAPLLAAEDPAKDFPAESPAPLTGIAPAAGLPAYDGDSESVRRDMVAPAPGAAEDEPARKKEPPQVRALREGITEAQVAGTTEWRVPVTMRAGASGRMSQWSYGGETSVRHISEDFTVLLKFEYKRTDFAFDGVPAAPWGDTEIYRLSGHTETTISGGWGLFANGGVRIGKEIGASTEDAISGQFAAGARYRFIPEFSYYFGLSMITRLDDDPLFIPVAAFNFRMGKWSATTMNGILLGYDVHGDRDLVIEASVFYDAPDFRLKPAPGTGFRRSVEFQEVPLTLSVTKRVAGRAFVKVYATTILWNDYRLRTDSTTIGDFQTPPGFAIGLSAGAKF